MSDRLDEHARKRLLEYLRELHIRVEIHEPIEVLLDAVNNPERLREWLQRKYPEESPEKIVLYWAELHAAGATLNAMSEAFEDGKAPTS